MENQDPILPAINRALTDQIYAEYLQERAKAAIDKSPDSEEMTALLRAMDVTPETLARLRPVGDGGGDDGNETARKTTTLTTTTFTTVPCFTTTTTTTTTDFLTARPPES